MLVVFVVMRNTESVDGGAERDLPEVCFRLLGPVAVLRADTVLELRGATARAMLAVLLLRGPAGAGIDELIGSVWDGPGAASRDSVYHYVRQLRRALPAGTLVSRDGGYRLLVDDAAVDWRRFQRLVAAGRRAREAGEQDRGAVLLRRALGEWAGPPLADVGDRLGPAREELALARLTAVEELAAAEAALHRPEQVVELLRPELAGNPGRERAAALLIEALAALGRRDEAGEVYRRTRECLVAELGLEPSEFLTAAHRTALRGAVPTPSPVFPQPAGAGLPVSGLPMRTTHFTGRDRELVDVLAALRADHGPPGQSAACVIHGMAGAGKTALAVRAAYELAERFPDGCLFVDLHGYAPGGTPTPAGEVLDRLLRRLGVAGDRIPAHPDDRAALYRDQLARRRLLVLLDNARDAGHVRPLLPATPGCALLVTSRDRLVGLDEAAPVPLAPLAGVTAGALFRSVAGARRMGTGREAAGAVDRIVAACGGLPLAIRIAAARYRANPAQTLADLAAGLEDRRTTFQELDDGDRSVSAALAASYTELPSPDRTALATLALHPGPALGLAAAAALTGEPVAVAARRVEHLADRNLLQPHSRHRYRFHDLVGAFARQRAAAELTATARAAALRRVTDHYLATAEWADTLIADRYRIPLDLAYPPERLPAGGGYPEALDWLVTEEANLVGACELAAAEGLDASCWQLAYTMYGYFFLTKRWQPWQRTHELALAASRRLGDRRAEAITLNHLGVAHLDHRLETAVGYFRQALALSEATGDEHNEHTALANLAWSAYSAGRYHDFLAGSVRPLEFYQRNDLPRNAAITLRGVALAELELGRTARAIEHFQALLRDFEELAQPLDVTMTLNGLGEAYRQAGEPAQAAAYHHRALAAAERCGSAYELARAHHRLGQLAAAEGHLDRAREHWSRAVAGYRTLGAPQAEQVRGELAALGV